MQTTPTIGISLIVFNAKLIFINNTQKQKGFNVESVSRKNITFSVWDVGGQDQVNLYFHFLFLDVVIYEKTFIRFVVYGVTTF